MIDFWKTFGIADGVCPEIAAAAVAGAALLALTFLMWCRWRTGKAKRTRGPNYAREESGVSVVRPTAWKLPHEPMRRGLGKTRRGFLARIRPLLAGTHLGPDALNDLEAALLGADVGVAMTDRLLGALRECPKGDHESVRGLLEREIVSILESPGTPRTQPTAKPWVVLVVGVNGVGKTTAVGKLAYRYGLAGRSTLLVAADTFRAAAIEQLAIWADHTRAQLIRHQPGSDPAAVVYDGISAAVARKMDVVLVDTAGRLHSKANLMAELRKVRRVMDRTLPGAPHETLLVLDAVTGQNGLVQARAFLHDLGVTGVVLNKLDGTAKGGVVIAIAGELAVPIRYVGIGERPEDLRDFSPREFVSALLDASNQDDSLDT